MELDRFSISIKTTGDMYRDANQAADREARTLADWIRQAMCLALERPDLMREVRCKPAYQMKGRGRPT